jgi:flagellar basal-body rod protein FlgB
MEASKISQLVSKHFAYYAEKSKVIASNIANIDTPNYKTKELSKFEDILTKESGGNSQSLLSLNTTNKAHIQINAKPYPKYATTLVPDLKEDSSGNNVDLDKQMAEHAKNFLVFNGTQAMFKRDHKLMKSVIDSSAKSN